jgi:hypothetical protein
VLADATLLAALDGSRPLTAGERAALQASPLTARRLRQLALDRAPRAGRRARSRGWRGSQRPPACGQQRRGATPCAPTTAGSPCTWLPKAAAGAVILQLSPDAPFAPALLAARAPLRVLDGAGRTILEGRLDADGECEAAWPFADAPASHLQAHGAAFSVEPLPRMRT